jgi:AcrR family transcriptional regulator
MIESQIYCTPRESRAEARRRQLIEAARKLFIANGFHATGIAQISEQSGIAVGQIYRDFSCKEEIVAAIVTDDCAQFMDTQQLEAAVAKQDRAATRTWIEHFLEPGAPVESDRLFSEIVAESSRNPRIAAIFLQLQSEFENRLLQALTLLVPDKRHAGRRRALADSIMTLSIGLQQHRLVRPKLHLRPLSDMLKSMIGREIDLLSQPA